MKYSFLLAVAYICSTFNNTLITVTSIKGKNLIFASAGFLGLKGAKRSTTFSGEAISSVLGKKICELGIKFLQIRLKGFGNSRKSVQKGFSKYLKIISVKNFTFLSHNGCRLKKKRRI